MIKYVTDWDVFTNFSRSEFECPCCGEALMQHHHVAKIQSMRSYLGHPIIVTSGYRCLEYNKSIGGSPRHPSGLATDMFMANERLDAALAYVLQHFLGVGVRRHGPHHRRFIHADDYEKGFWTYP